MAFSFLSETGQVDESFVKGEGIEAVLVDWGNEVIEKLQKSLLAKTSENTTLNLYQSLVVLPIEIGNSKFTLQFQSEDYWKFINSGVSGKGGSKKDGSVWENKGIGSPFTFKDKAPPADALKLWATVKGINVFALQKSIFHKGIKPTHFWDEVVNESLVKDLVKRLEKAGAREVEIILAKE